MLPIWNLSGRKLSTKQKHCCPSWKNFRNSLQNSSMTTDKQGINHLVKICTEKGLEKVIISPGSRNAPLTIAFNRSPLIDCLSIVDERSAGFFGLGIAQQSQKPVGLVSTSGSAALNYAPAIVEAYYQHQPLVVMTADRPHEWIDQGESQVIRQKGIFSNYIKGSFEIPQDITDKDDLWYHDRIISEAFNLAMTAPMGPVHINVPFKEPLYQEVEEVETNPKIISKLKTSSILDAAIIKELKEEWKSYSKKIILAGVLPKNSHLNDLINKLGEDPSVVVLTETTSNLYGKRFIQCIDKVIATIQVEEESKFRPQLLVTIGDRIISKMVKAFMRKNGRFENWHIDESGHALDTFQNLSKIIPLKPEDFFAELVKIETNTDSDFRNLWVDRYCISEEMHMRYLKKTEYSDLKVFEAILEKLPTGVNLQMANSTPVRYVQLFRQREDLTFNSNRGTSGIDGCTSTAAGAAYIQDDLTVLVTGDLGFFYDSNALWNAHLKPNLKIIVINNSGGGIFRFIDGPSTLPELEEFFETSHNYPAEGIARSFNILYQSCRDLNSLIEQLNKFFSLKDRPEILEIFTPNEKNGEILKNYFKNLKRQ